MPDLAALIAAQEAKTKGSAVPTAKPSGGPKKAEGGGTVAADNAKTTPQTSKKARSDDDKPSETPATTGSPVQASKKRPPTAKDLSSPEDRYERFARAYIFGVGKGAKPFNGSAAYRVAFGSSVKSSTARTEASKLLTKPNMKAVLARVALEAWRENKIEEQYVIESWIHASKANIFDYFEMEQHPDRPGYLIVKGHQLNDLPTAIQMNVKKMKVTNHWIPREDGPDEVEQTIELEIIDRLAVLRDIAKWRNMFSAAEEDASDLVADLIARGQKRAQQRGVVIDGTTGQTID